MKKFTIPKGRHFARGLHLNFYIAKSYLRIRGRFGSSCKYDLGTSDQEDINKLMGLTPGFIRSRNSARIGWRYVLERQQIELLHYCHIAGKAKFGSLGFVELEADFEASIEANPKDYVFKVSTPFAAETKITKPRTIKFGYRNVPYFGGNRTAPHDMDLWIEVLKFN